MTPVPFPKEKTEKKEKLSAVVNLDFKFNYEPYGSKENLILKKKQIIL